MKKLDLLRSLPVSKIMNIKPISVAATTPIAKITSLFLNNHINILTVRKGNKFVGEIHQLDLLKLAVDPDKIPREDIITLGFGVDMGYFAKTAKDIMNPNDETIEPETTIGEAAQIMLKEEDRSLPVVKDGKLLGVITEKEILRRLLR